LLLIVTQYKRTTAARSTLAAVGFRLPTPVDDDDDADIEMVDELGDFDLSNIGMTGEQKQSLLSFPKIGFPTFSVKLRPPRVRLPFLPKRSPRSLPIELEDEVKIESGGYDGDDGDVDDFDEHNEVEIESGGNDEDDDDDISEHCSESDENRFLPIGLITPFLAMLGRATAATLSPSLVFSVVAASVMLRGQRRTNSSFTDDPPSSRRATTTTAAAAAARSRGRPSPPSVSVKQSSAYVLELEERLVCAEEDKGAAVKAARAKVVALAQSKIDDLVKQNRQLRADLKHASAEGPLEAGSSSKKRKDGTARYKTEQEVQAAVAKAVAAARAEATAGGSSAAEVAAAGSLERAVREAEVKVEEADRRAAGARADGIEATRREAQEERTELELSLALATDSAAEADRQRAKAEKATAKAQKEAAHALAMAEAVKAELAELSAVQETMEDHLGEKEEAGQEATEAAIAEAVATAVTEVEAASAAHEASLVATHAAASESARQEHAAELRRLQSMMRSALEKSRQARKHKRKKGGE